MKRKTKIIIGSVAGVLCLLAVVVAFLSVGRAGGEIGFEATINQIENGVAYATVTADDAGFSVLLINAFKITHYLTSFTIMIVIIDFRYNLFSILPYTFQI